MGVVLSFISVSIYGYNLPEWQGIYSYFSYSTIPIGSFAVVNFSWDLLFSKKNKKYALGAVVVISIVYYITLYATWETSVVVVDLSGDTVMEDWLSPTSVPYWLIWALVGLGALVWASGFRRFRKRSPGELRKRANYLLIATLFIGGSILLDTVILMNAETYLLILAKLWMIPGLFLGYYGLKPVE
jgi:hypothetical protein